MTIYVSELPKSCKECPFHDTKYGICDISGSRVEYFGCHSLTPLSDYTKQVKKEVCEDIKNKLDEISGEHDVKVKGGIGKFTCVPRYSLEQLLEQVQGENNG